MVLVKHKITGKTKYIPENILGCVGLKYKVDDEIWFNDGKWEIVNFFTNKKQPLTIQQPVFNKNNDIKAHQGDKFNSSWNNTTPIQIQHIKFNKIYLSASNDIYSSDYHISDYTINYNNITISGEQNNNITHSFNYSSKSQHITSHDNQGNINLWTISPSIPIPTPAYGISISLQSGKENIEDWSNINNISNYKVTWIGSVPVDRVVINPLLDINRIKPHWEKNDDKITYYGGGAQLFDALATTQTFTKFEIYLEDDVVLPFGFSTSIFQMSISSLSSQGQKDISTLIGSTNKLPIIVDPQFKQDPTKHSYFTIQDINEIKKHINGAGTLSEYIKQHKTSYNDETIKISGGTINGYILKTSKFEYSTTSADKDYAYLSMPWYGDPNSLRADTFSSSSDLSKLSPYKFLRIIEYWIFYGLLELNANHIELNNISVLCGSPRGISPVQLNGYVHKSIPNTSNTSVTITNCQFCLNHYGQTDGLDVLSDNVTYNSVYFQVADDGFKLASGNIIGQDITIVSGAAGGAINFHAYGTNVSPDISANIKNIYIHLYNKPNTASYNEDCAKKYVKSNKYCYEDKDCNGCNWWPGPAIIFAPVYPLLANTTSFITISGVYVTNSIHYNVSPQRSSKPEPDMFMTGGWMNQLNTDKPTSEKNLMFTWNIWDVYYNNVLQQPADHLSIFLILKNTPNNNKIKLTGIYNADQYGIYANDASNYIVHTNTIQKPDPIRPGVLRNQQWTVNPNNNPTQIKLIHSDNKCLDIPGNYNINTGYPAGYKLWIWDCNYAYTWNISGSSYYYKNNAHESTPLYLNFDNSNFAILDTKAAPFSQTTNNQLKTTAGCLDNLGGKSQNGNFVGRWTCAK